MCAMWIVGWGLVRLGMGVCEFWTRGEGRSALGSGGCGRGNRGREVCVSSLLLRLPARGRK